MPQANNKALFFSNHISNIIIVINLAQKTKGLVIMGILPTSIQFEPPLSSVHHKTSKKASLLHVRAPAIRLRRHGLALDALRARVVLAGILADAGGAGVGRDGRLAGAVALGVAGGVVGAQALLLGLLLLELLACAGAAAERDMG
jgi:hypothetical protein